MSDFLDKLSQFIKLEVKDDNDYIEHLQFIKDNRQHWDEPNTKDYLDKLLVYYFEANKRTFVDDCFNEDLCVLVEIYNRYKQRVSSQSKLDITQSLVLILLNCKSIECAKCLVKEYIYTLFKEIYSDISNSENSITAFLFRPFSIYALNDIALSQITFSNPKEFNDPFDMLLPHWLEYKLGQHNTVPTHQYLKLMQDMCKYIRVRSLVASFDKDVENMPLLMWAHYADYHKGFCIKYEFDKAFFMANDESKFALVWKNINYVYNDFPYTDKIRLSEALIMKSYIWNYEHELRLLMFDPSKEDVHVPIHLGEHARITDIYLGEHCSDENVSFIKSVVTGRGIRLYKMKKNDNCAFKLDRVPV